MTATAPLFDMPLGDLVRALRAGAPAYLLVNPTEYHGPHLSLLNDHIVSSGLARDLHAAIAKPGEPFLLSRDLDVGVDPTFGPGTVATSYADACHAVMHACETLVEYGAKRVALMTFHGSPNHAMALETGVRFLKAKGVRVISPLNELLQFLLSPDRSVLEPAYATVADPQEREAMIEDASSDFHGGFIESSLALHFAPESVKSVIRELPPCPPLVPNARYVWAASAASRAGCKTLAKELLLVGKAIAWGELRPFPGYTGRPHRANAKAGAMLATLIRDRYAALANAVFYGTGASPAPVMEWMPWATLGGRVAPPPPDLSEILTMNDVSAAN